MQSSSVPRFGGNIAVALIILVSLFFPEKAKAQQEDILLTFRYNSIANVYVSSLYDDNSNTVYLPVLELFSLLEINYQPDKKNFIVRGNFINADNQYSINFQTRQILLGKSSYQFSANDFRIADTDFYLSPKVLEEVFGLKFTIEIAPLLLSLETTKTLPVQERKARELARQRMENSAQIQESFPLGYDRKRTILGGTMLDYAITANYTPESKDLGYTFVGGMEVLGGDIQGTVNGVNSTTGLNSLTASDLRWRYAIRDNDFLSGIMLGQTNTTGLEPMSIRGIALTNDPIEPRQMYETSMVDGTTEPNSEVEIYVNEQLAGFKRADELGYYRFDVPITYGTTRMNLRIYTPSGRLIVTDKQMQVPFTFLPRGVVSYNIQAGETESYLADSIQGKWVTHGNVAMGLTNWLTANVGTQFLGTTFATNNLMYYGSVSARIAKQYLINIDAAPTNFYRFTGSVMYANNLSLNLIYTKFDGLSVFNSRGENQNINANVYMPFTLFGLNTGIRLSSEHIILTTGSRTDLSTDLNARMGKVDVRLNYRDNVLISDADTRFGDGVLTNTLTYTMSRTPGVPVYVRGMYLRLQNRYNVHANRMFDSEVNISRSVLKAGRLNFIVAYNYLSKIVNTQVGFTLDLSKVRSTTTINTSGNRISARQSVNGSIGWDMQNEAFDFSNRQQVGRSAASVLLFVDNNNSGHYDAGDQLLPCKGVKLDRTTTMEVGRDSILRLTQLQSYYKYNISVNRNAIPDPTLVPVKDKFSFIADPNQYKRIEIPFYRGGTVEGAVLIQRNGASSGQGGLRLNLKSVDTDFTAVVRTMSDGGFYVMDLAPGKYSIEVDTVQQGFLGVKQQNEKFNFNIKALAEGDYLEGLSIVLVPDNKVANSENLNSVNQLSEKTHNSIKVDSIGVVNSRSKNLELLSVNSVNKPDLNTESSNSNVVIPNTSIKTEASKNAILEKVKVTEPDSRFVPPVAQPTTWINSVVPPLTISPMRFPHNSSYPSNELKLFMDTLANVLNEITWKNLTIYCNADSTGTAEYNKWITIERAKKVKAYLIDKKVPAHKIIIIGNGEGMPIGTNSTKEGRELNRRIDFKLIK